MFSKISFLPALSFPQKRTSEPQNSHLTGIKKLFAVALKRAGQKTFCVFLLFFSAPALGQGIDFSNFTCVKDMRKFYPRLMEGGLDWKEQKRFFRCLHDILELFVKKDLFGHDPDKDYFSRRAIFNLFHIHFKYDTATSHRLTNQLFFAKKVLIGGSIDKLKDSELDTLYRLIYDYRDVYFILHRQIPVLRTAFRGRPGAVTEDQRQKALEQLRRAFVRLEQAYVREKIAYRIDDFQKYGRYFRESGLPGDAKTVERVALYVGNLFEGLFRPKTKIQDWSLAFQSLQDTVSLLLYHKTYFSANISREEFIYRLMESAEIFLDSLNIDKLSMRPGRRGFPLNNLDGMLFVIADFFVSEEGSVSSGRLAGFRSPKAISLLTRTLTCFSLGLNKRKGCESHWSGKPSSPVVTLSFPDSRFEIFSDKIKRTARSGRMLFFGQIEWLILKNWLANYKQGLVDMYYGRTEAVALKWGFSHWLRPFFGWDQSSSRLVFGDLQFVQPDNLFPKACELLNYQAFSALLFLSYLPEGFFPEQEESLSFAEWKAIVEDISPALVILGGESGYKAEWKSGLFDLFDLADSFLNSSNRDGQLSVSELFDLSAHFMEGVKNSRFAFQNISPPAGEQSLSPESAARGLLSSEETLSVFPRFKQYLFPLEVDKYQERIQALFEGQKEESFNSMSFLPLFILLQVMELNYDLIDANQSFNLESGELAVFCQTV